MQHVTSRRNPLVGRCRDAARGVDSEVLLLDGRHLVSEALTANLTIREAVVARDALEDAEMRALVAALTRRRVSVVTATPAVMELVSPVRSSSDVVAVAERPADGRERVYAGGSPLVLIAAGVQDPGNLGALVRVAEAGGATGLVAAGGGAQPWGWKALRGSMGSALRLPIAVYPQIAQAMEHARQHGCQIVAGVPGGGRSPFDVDLRGPLAILIGGEGIGISPELVAVADIQVTIPMRAPVESLNAAVAGAVLVYEANRQRRGPS